MPTESGTLFCSCAIHPRNIRLNCAIYSPGSVYGFWNKRQQRPLPPNGCFGLVVWSLGAGFPVTLYQNHGFQPRSHHPNQLGRDLMAKQVRVAARVFQLSKIGAHHKDLLALLMHTQTSVCLIQQTNVSEAHKASGQGVVCFGTQGFSMSTNPLFREWCDEFPARLREPQVCQMFCSCGLGGREGRGREAK